MISLAPGRMCLFGGHQDYLGLPFITCAITRDPKLNAVQNTTNAFKLDMMHMDSIRIIVLNEILTEFIHEVKDYLRINYPLLNWKKNQTKKPKIIIKSRRI